MASRRMRIKTLAKVPSASRPRPTDRPKTPVYDGDGSFPSITSPGILPPPSPLSKPPQFYDIGSPPSPKPSIYNIASPSSNYPPLSPKPPIMYNIASPLSVPPSSPKPSVYHLTHPVTSPKIHQSNDDVGSPHVMSIASAGLLSPRTPQPLPMPPSTALSTTSSNRPDSRPSTPKTPHSYQIDHENNSQDNFLNPPTPTPAFVSSYSALSPGMGPGISLGIARAPPSVSPGSSTSCSSLPDESTVVPTTKSAFAPATRHFNFSAPDSSSQGKSKPSSLVNRSNKAKAATTVQSPSTPQNQLVPVILPPPSPQKESQSSTRSHAASVSGSSDTLRQRLQKSSIAPSTSKYAMIRKDYLTKYQNKTPNPKDLTILHYAFFNPPKADNEASDDDATGENEDEVLQNESTPESKRSKRKRTSIDADEPPPTRASVEPEPKKSTPTPATDETEKSVGPRVKVGPDGQLIVDEQSLVTITSEAERAKERLAQMETVSGASFVVGSSGMYRKKAFKRGTDWSVKETIKFYRGLMSCGTDFSMMASLFKNRTRSELKAKFKREDRRNQAQVSRALSTQVFNPTLPLTDSDDDDDEEKEQEVEEDIVTKASKGMGTRSRRKALPEVDNLISEPTSKAVSPSKQLSTCDKEAELTKPPRKPRRKSAAVAPSVEKFLTKNPKSRRVDCDLVQSSIGTSETPKVNKEPQNKSPKKVNSLRRTAIPSKQRVPGPGAGFKEKEPNQPSGEVEIEIEIEIR